MDCAKMFHSKSVIPKNKFLQKKLMVSLLLLDERAPRLVVLPVTTANTSPIPTTIDEAMDEASSWPCSTNSDRRQRTT